MKRPNLEFFLKRATAGQSGDSRRHFSPSLFYRLINDSFGVWCDYYAPKNEAVPEPSRYEDMRKQRGKDFERLWIEGQYPYAVKVEPEFGIQALKMTLHLMLNGEEAIAAPQLWALEDETYGRGDLIIRDNSHPSDLGPYHYKVKEIKLSSKLQDYHSLQAALYNRMLGKIQGYTPPIAEVILNGKKARVNFREIEPDLDEKLKLWRSIRDGTFQPEPSKPDDTQQPWRVYTNKILAQRRDLTLIADVGQSTRKKLRKTLGVQKIEDLFPLAIKDLRRNLSDGAAEDLFYHVQAFKLNKPIRRPDRALEIPRARRNLYFDFETSDEVHPTEPPHVYLIGLWDKEQAKFVYFLAHGHQEEEKIFKEFLDYVGNPQETVLYHWTDFEIGQMKAVMQKYPDITDRMEASVRSCVDLKEAIKGKVYFPTPTYSVKKIGPYLGFNWRQKDVGAFESMVLYWDWLKTDDSALIQKVLDYNEDDCRVMLYIDEKLY